MTTPWLMTTPRLSAGLPPNHTYVCIPGLPCEVMTQDRAVATRRRLLDATVSLLRARGATALTSREIARAAGANLQAITYHFGSKDQLVAQALTGLVADRVAPIRAALDSDGDPAERLFAALRTIGGTFPVARDDLAAYASAVAMSSSNATLATALSELHRELIDYLAGVVAELQADGYIQGWVRPRAMAELLVSIGDGVAMRAHYSEPDVGGVLDQVALLLLAARDQSSRVWPAAARALLTRVRKG